MNLTKEAIISSAIDIFGYSADDFLRGREDNYKPMTKPEIISYLTTSQLEEIKAYCK